MIAEFNTITVQDSFSDLSIGSRSGLKLDTAIKITPSKIHDENQTLPPIPTTNWGLPVNLDKRMIKRNPPSQIANNELFNRFSFP